MKQNIITLRIPEDASWYAKDFRKAVAKMADKMSLDIADIFHYDENGQSLNSKPKCRFFSTKNQVGFASESSSKDVARISGPIMMAASSHLGNVDVGMKMFTREKQAYFSDRPYTYLLTNAVRKARTERWRKMSTQEIVKSLVFNMLNDAVEDGVLLDMPPESMINIVVHEHRQGGIDIKSGEYAHLIYATFSMNIKLEGFWFAGQLTTRGHGMIHYKDPSQMRGGDE